MWVQVLSHGFQKQDLISCCREVGSRCESAHWPRGLGQRFELGSRVTSDKCLAVICVLYWLIQIFCSVSMISSRLTLLSSCIHVLPSILRPQWLTRGRTSLSTLGCPNRYTNIHHCQARTDGLRPELNTTSAFAVPRASGYLQCP